MEPLYVHDDQQYPFNVLNFDPAGPRMHQNAIQPTDHLIVSEPEERHFPDFDFPDDLNAITNYPPFEHLSNVDEPPWIPRHQSHYIPQHRDEENLGVVPNYSHPLKERPIRYRRGSSQCIERQVPIWEHPSNQDDPNPQDVGDQWHTQGEGAGHVVDQQAHASFRTESEFATEFSYLNDNDNHTTFSYTAAEQLTTCTSSLPQEPAPPLPENGALICDGCGKSFTKLSILSKHKRYHMPEEMRPYRCDHCNMGFVFPKDLKRHNSTHSKPEQEHQCPDCKNVYSRADNLNRHRLTCSSIKRSKSASAHARDTQSKASRPRSVRARTNSNRSLAAAPQSVPMQSVQEPGAFAPSTNLQLPSPSTPSRWGAGYGNPRWNPTFEQETQYMTPPGTGGSSYIEGPAYGPIDPNLGGFVLDPTSPTPRPNVLPTYYY